MKMSNPYDVVKQFEAALCEYTGAKYAVTVTSCTMAILLAVKWHLKNRQGWNILVEIPKYTYVGVPMSIVNAGGWPVFRDDTWNWYYQLRPLEVYDYARWFYSGMYQPRRFQCVSFHHTKTLGLAAHGGAILHDNDEADEWLRRARFDGRKEGVAPKDDTFPMIGHHCYMTPATAAEGLMRLASLPKHNDPLPWGPGTSSDYPDLSLLEIFK